MKKIPVLLSQFFPFILAALLLLAITGAGETPVTYYVPQSFDFAKNFYNSYGSPDITATIIGSNEFERGQTVTLNIDLMNRGKFLGFESDRTPSGADEIYAAKTEVKLEGKIVDASGIVASLSAGQGSPIEVKSVSQQVGSIRSGQNALTPAKFDLKIDKKAKAGEYLLRLDLTYDYQKNVQIINSNATQETYDANYWYGMMKQNQTLKVIVKKQADFEITKTSGSLLPGRESVIEITIKNTGEEEARDVMAIINPSDPISTTDDKAFLYNLEPGSSVTAKYMIKADSKAVPKSYSMDTVLRYETPEGDIKYSSALQAPVEVKEIGFLQRLFGWI
ncbi:MAG: hypothetical protein PHH85_01420 [Candidatus Methanoperedens sp.]|nr:hypothetical protein [Candidatus Methanoperedens sp.]